MEIRDGVPIIFARRPAREDNSAYQVGETLGVFELGSKMIDCRCDQVEPGSPQTHVLDAHVVNLPDSDRRGCVRARFRRVLHVVHFEYNGDPSARRDSAQRVRIVRGEVSGNIALIRSTKD